MPITRDSMEKMCRTSLKWNRSRTMVRAITMPPQPARAWATRSTSSIGWEVARAQPMVARI